MQDAEAGDGGEEDDGAPRAGGDHAAGAGLGDEEGAREVDVEEGAEGGGVVGFGFDVGTGLGWAMCGERMMGWSVMCAHIHKQRS